MARYCSTQPCLPETPCQNWWECFHSDRPCLCADPENCNESVLGYICKAGKARSPAGEGAENG